MIHRLGMYYLARQLQDAQDEKSAPRPERDARRIAVADREEFGVLARAAAILTVVTAILAFGLWLAR